eukprot:114195-Pyramimonas_sp.AAC.1
MGVRRPLSPPVDSAERRQVAFSPELLPYPWPKRLLVVGFDIPAGKSMALAQEAEAFAAQRSGPSDMAKTALHYLASSLASAKECFYPLPGAPDVPSFQTDSVPRRYRGPRGI